MNANESGSTVETSSNKDESSEVSARSKAFRRAVDRLSEIPGVGSVRAMRLVRDTSIRSLNDVVIADVEELLKVWSIGEWTAMSVRTSARSILADERDGIGVGENPERVAVVAGDGAFEGMDETMVWGFLDAAMSEAGVEFDESTEVGFVTGGMGGDTISTWLDRKVAKGVWLSKQPFNTPWEKYATWCSDDPSRGKDGVSIATLPFDVVRPEDVEWWMAPTERTNTMVAWADEVVVAVNGEHAYQFRDQCDDEDVPCTTVFAELGTEEDERMLRMWDAPIDWDDRLDHGMDVDDQQSVIGDYGARGESEEDSDSEDESDMDVDEQVCASDVTGARRGSVEDLASEDELTMEPNDRDEHRPQDETGGKGVGSRQDRWG